MSELEIRRYYRRSSSGSRRPVSISADSALIDRIDALAAAEQRSRSSWIELALEQAVEQQPPEAAA